MPGLRNLREHGPAGSVFLRFGRDHMQPLGEATAAAKRPRPGKRAGNQARRGQCKEQLRRAGRTAEDQAGSAPSGVRRLRREVHRRTVEGHRTRTGWGTPRDAHPHLCDACKHRAVTTEPRAGQPEHEPQERDRTRAVSGGCTAVRAGR
ncbi:hypothetical protein ACFZCY_43170 [Streptomyces sp. NPDC007983]|uniref:hypothetical protein n=1 Tax=Streptomyces sp. NPDC007983 TaxID=3364800 RepID=UPI0036E9C40B